MPDRDAALAALNSHLALNAGDSTHILEPEVRRAARDLERVTDPEHDLSAAQVLGWYHWLRHLALPAGDGRNDLAAATRFFAPVHRVSPQSVPEPLHRTLQESAVRPPVPEFDPRALATAQARAVDLLTAYERTGQQDVLEQAVAAFRTVSTMLPEDHPSHAAGLNNLGNALQFLSEHVGEIEVLEEAVQVSRRAVTATSQDQADRAGYLNSLGAALFRMFERVGDIEALQEALEVQRKAVAAIPQGHQYRAMYLNNLGNTLRTHFERIGDLAVLEEAVQLGREAVTTTPRNDPGRAAYLNDFGNTLRTHFERIGDLAVLEEAAQFGREAVTTAPRDHPNRAKYLHNLGNTLQSLFGRVDDIKVLKEAVQISRNAVAAAPQGHPHRAMYLNSLVNALQTLSGRTGRPEALEEAVQAGREAVTTTPHNHPNRAGYLTSLGVALQRLFERVGDTEVLREAVQVNREAVATITHNDPHRVISLNNLGNILQTLFERTGDIEVLKEAAQVNRKAVATTPHNHPHRAAYLNNLAGKLLALFEHIGEIEVLKEAVQVVREALATTPDNHPHHAVHLSNLGNILQTLFERTGDIEVLKEAAQVNRKAVATTPHNHPHRAVHLNNLTGTLANLFEHDGDIKVLKEAVKTSRKTVAASPRNHPSHAMYLYNLGNTLQTLFERITDIEVLEEAIRVNREAVSATPHDHPHRAVYLNSLGGKLANLFEVSGGTQAREDACRYFHEAAGSTTGDMVTRIKAYRRFALLASGPDTPQPRLEALEKAIDLTASLAPGSLGRVDREYQLGRLPGLPAEAAAAALAAGRPARAVELLESARGILAADTLDLRSRDSVRLREHAPHLADELRQLRARLDALNRPLPTSSAETPETLREANQRLAEHRREAHDAWQSLLARISGLPDFEDFLHAPPVNELARHAHEGPVVFVTAGPRRCDALVLTDSADAPVRVVPLPALTQDAAFDQGERLLDALHATTDQEIAPRARIEAQQEILAVLAWLWDTVAEPVLTELGHTTAHQPGEPWPRLWWCPVGILAYFPLHAAGHHTDDLQREGGPRTVIDRVVSSYTTTVRALADARTRRSRPSSPSILVVAAAHAAGTPPLPGVRVEAAAITSLMPDARILATPTRDTVLNALPSHGIAHFSCHGEANWTDPARSHLVLTDHTTAPLTIADITALDLTAELAYLSACDTSRTAPRLADESLHITGAFHLAGYRHVIGTLWPVDDRTAAQLGTDFYAHLTDNGTTPPKTDLSALALHLAAARLRSRYPHAPSLWAAHTHTGT
ncbi:CHAT domain-containing protein [Streptomyces sp. NBC_01285]|uniref:CHAT domain-containing protein n=1 Tax=Streptomyces sp. NBC_01285 TaxID=2903813 RepID=UPI00225B5693|nr:CHAT domain-containing protein [Streptomyces sp. NBC_01285]MCX4773713.1 CHAT domain-containing protein [Streptomyces sp. NBC_01285]